MKTNQVVTILVSIQIFLIIVSFLSLSYFESEHKTFENSLIAVSHLKQHSDELIFETDRHIHGISNADPQDIIQHMKKSMELIKSGGFSHELVLNPLPKKFNNAYDAADKQLITYTNYIENVLNDEKKEFDFNSSKFTIIDTARFDVKGSLDYLLSTLLEENKIYSKNLIILQIGLAILNVGIHIMMIIIILDLLKKQSDKEIRLQKLASIGELASRVSHDIRSPLSVIKATVDLMLSKKSTITDEKDIKHLELMKKSVIQMNDQVEDVLDFVRTNKISLEKSSLLEIINQATKRVSIPDSVKVSFPKTDYHINCDKLKMEIVFANLLSNALDAINREGKIEVKMEEEGKRIEIKIEDSGPGIDPEFLPKIFDPLFTQKRKGTGLGLASCKNIIEQHKGTINASNNPTTFTITIPSNL